MQVYSHSLHRDHNNNNNNNKVQTYISQDKQQRLPREAGLLEPQSGKGAIYPLSLPIGLDIKYRKLN